MSVAIDDRQAIQRMAQAVAAENAHRESLTRRILAEVSSGPPVTRRELLYILYSKPSMRQQHTLNKMVSRLLKLGQIVERPMLGPAGPGVRVEPVMVLEVVR